MPKQQLLLLLKGLVLHWLN